MVFEKVAEMLANHLSIEQDSIKMVTTFEELGVDSLDTVEMVMDLEESLGIELELEKKGKILPFEEVLRDMEYRDKNDSSRAAAPLRPAEDAVRLDTTQLDFDESCAAVESLIRERFAL